MHRHFQITNKFEKDLIKFDSDDKNKITESINNCSLLTQKKKIRANQLYQPHDIKLVGNLDSSLYVLKVSPKIRVLLTIDEDPLFDKVIITLLRVVKTDKTEKTFMSLSESLYPQMLAQA